MIRGEYIQNLTFYLILRAQGTVIKPRGGAMDKKVDEQMRRKLVRIVE